MMCTLAIITIIGANCTRRAGKMKNGPLDYIKVSVYEKINKKLQNFGCSEVF